MGHRTLDSSPARFLPTIVMLALQANVYNVLNINKALGVTPLSGPNLLIPTAITPPRIGEVGITYSF